MLGYFGIPPSPAKFQAGLMFGNLGLSIKCFDGEEPIKSSSLIFESVFDVEIEMRIRCAFPPIICEKIFLSLSLSLTAQLCLIEAKKQQQKMVY